MWIPLSRCYTDALHSRPVFAKSVTAGLIFAAAEATAQRIQRQRAPASGRGARLSPVAGADTARVGASALVGLLFAGPSLHAWFEVLAATLPARDVKTLALKTLLGQLLYGPLAVLVFFAALAAVDDPQPAPPLSAATPGWSNRSWRRCVVCVCVCARRAQRRRANHTRVARRTPLLEVYGPRASRAGADPRTWCRVLARRRLPELCVRPVGLDAPRQQRRDVRVDRAARRHGQHHTRTLPWPWIALPAGPCRLPLRAPGVGKRFTILALILSYHSKASKFLAALAPQPLSAFASRTGEVVARWVAIHRLVQLPRT